jgi:uncharacterized protein (TIGR02246 family)
MRISVAIVTMGLVVTSAASAGDLKADLMSLEKVSWDAWYKADVKTYNDTMTDDALMNFSDGTSASGRKAITDLVASRKCTVNSLTFHDEQARALGADAAFVTYTVKQDVTCADGKQPDKVVGTAIYVRRDGQWRWAGYQETAVD